MPFEHFIGIDYSGAATPKKGLSGIRVYKATLRNEPTEIHPPDRKKLWSRLSLYQWLDQYLGTQPPSLIGIDHGLGFPRKYREKYHLPENWDKILEDFCRHWPTHRPNTRVDDLRSAKSGYPQQREGDSRWRRITDTLAGAKSVFHFDVPGSVAKSTHAGLPFILQLRNHHHLFCWPWDGWQPPDNQHVLVEAYPSMWRNAIPDDPLTPDQRDAWTISRTFREVALSHTFKSFFQPPENPAIRKTARIEGWIPGLQG